MPWSVVRGSRFGNDESLSERLLIRLTHDLFADTRLPTTDGGLGAHETRLKPLAATAALDHAHWKLNPPSRPSTSSISPTR